MRPITTIGEPASRGPATRASPGTCERPQLGPDHPDTLNQPEQPRRWPLGHRSAYRAIPLLERTLAARSARLCPDHPDSLKSQNNLARVYQAAGALYLAIPLLERTLAVRSASSAPTMPRHASARATLRTATGLLAGSIARSRGANGRWRLSPLSPAPTIPTHSRAATPSRFLP